MKAKSVSRTISRVKRTLDSLERCETLASREFGGWRKRKPNTQGIWVGAKWQKDGYFQLHRYPATVSLAELRRQPDEFWAGPFTRSQARSRWMEFLPAPVAATAK